MSLFWHDRRVSNAEDVDAPAMPAASPKAAASPKGAAPRDRSHQDPDASGRDWVGTPTAHEPSGGLLAAGDEEPPPVAPAVPVGATRATAAATEPDGRSGGGVDGALGSRAPSPGEASPSPLPDPAAAAAVSELEPLQQVARATGPPRRPSMLVQGLWPAALAGGLVLATTFGLFPLAVAVLAVQVFLVLGALALLDAPAAGGASIVAIATAVVADVLVLTDDGRVTGLAGAAALGLVGSLVHQLSRKGRNRVTESLADTLVVIVVAVAAACLIALQQVEGGEHVLLISLAAAGAVLLAARIGDWLAPRPRLAVGSTRGWPGLVLGLGAGVACALLVADAGNELPLTSAALLGLVVASTVATADLAVDLGAAELRSGWRDARRVAALRPTALLLPFAVLGPVALLAGRLVLT